MQSCRIVKTNEYTTKKEIWWTFKSKKAALEHLRYYKKTLAKQLYSKATFSQNNQLLTCHHAYNDNVDYWRIEPVNP